MHPRKTFFTLPNLFTLGNIFCGLFSLTLSAGEPTPEQLYQAAVAIAFGYIFDLADGRVARLTRTQSALGVQLDSLADVITFGVAPAMMVYKWGLSRLEGLIPHVGLLVAFMYVGAAALRLARFNVLSMEKTSATSDPGGFILGLPVPVASAVLVALVWLNHQLIQRGSQIASLGEGTLAALVVVLSGLQISKVRFRSFKNVRLRSRRVFLVAGAILALMGVGLVLQWPSALIFVGLLLAYLTLGIFEEIIFLRRRRAEERQAPSQDANEGRAESDEDVLRELGAYEDAQEDGQPRGAGV